MRGVNQTYIIAANRTKLELKREYAKPAFASLFCQSYQTGIETWMAPDGMLHGQTANRTKLELKQNSFRYLRFYAHICQSYQTGIETDIFIRELFG